MSAVLALAPLLEARQVWKGKTAANGTGSHQPTGWPALDSVLPGGGWPDAALSEVLLPVDGVGELRLLAPALARLSQTTRPIAVVAPPYVPCVAGWQQLGIAMQQVEIIQAQGSDALWAAEQCLRSGSCSAVLAWPQQVDDRVLRKLQVAAGTGQAQAWVFRDRHCLRQPSPAALRVELVSQPTPGIRVHKCRGAHAPATLIALDLFG
ncbi:translesion DNA synthesis-associated protein ImuA [Oleiagrimonas sp. C23AA]|uniref:translesion DNA synthesis-associated protein ImuA n=1 Tax=Oleiagrimonas sp. C23AA TaxID=2719047 RepID=UPI0014242C10|nr:translesion DNA synthesis-associated protein ImuA [Oleiagrimonas sp. C23AA]NII10950.1 translesion DNA synthesis-associated protein ImuA [Oleiagrimonas sp. C23AA]